MLPKEVLKSVRRIQISTNRLVMDVFAGQYHSIFKGQGIEFDEVREYSPGDEIRSIDWNVTARMNNPYVKKFVEERELTVMLMLDVSQSTSFGSTRYMKAKTAAELCSLLAFSAIKNNDKVGLIAFTDKIEKFISPRKGVGHVLHVIREALCFKAKSKGTSINTALEYLNKVTKRRTVTFIISDFYDADFQKLLKTTNKRHDVVAITITDPLELELPNAGILRLHDAENGNEFLIDTSNKRVRTQYKTNALKRFNSRIEIFKKANVDYIDVRTDLPYINRLVRFFKDRELRMR